jgi:hypothetical protein
MIDGDYACMKTAQAESELGEFLLRSDMITHSYKNHKRKQRIIPPSVSTYAEHQI